MLIARLVVELTTQLILIIVCYCCDQLGEQLNLLNSNKLDGVDQCSANSSLFANSSRIDSSRIYLLIFKGFFNAPNLLVWL